MPTSLEHQKQYEHNKKFLSQVMALDGYEDWQITVSFYCAVHYLEKLLWECNESLKASKRLVHGFSGEPDDHKQRREFLVKTEQFESYNNRYLTAYDVLISKCHKARYKCFMPSKREAEKAASRLATIENIKQLTIKKR